MKLTVVTPHQTLPLDYEDMHPVKILLTGMLKLGQFHLTGNYMAEVGKIV